MRFCLIYRLVYTRIRTVKLTAIFYFTYNLHNFSLSLFFSLHLYNLSTNTVNYQYSANISISSLHFFWFTDIPLTSYTKIFFFLPVLFCCLKKKRKRRNFFFSVFTKRSISRVEENFCTRPFLNFFTFHVYLLYVYENNFILVSFFNER